MMQSNYYTQRHSSSRIWITLLAWCLLVIAAPQATADDTPASDWILGTWTVSYNDLVFTDDFHINEINGTAFVHRTSASRNGGEVGYFAVVQFQDPSDGAVYRMHSASIEIDGNNATIVLPGTCPTRSRTSDGKPDVRDWFPNAAGEDEDPDHPRVDHTLLTVEPGDTLTIRPAEDYAGPTVRLHAPPSRYPAQERYTLTLERGANANDTMMTGTWSYPLGPAGMYGRRVGKTDEDAQIVTGPETWLRSQSDAILSVTEDRVARQMIEGRDNREPAVLTRLKIRGWDLPTTAQQLGENVSFTDPLIHFGRFVSATAASPTNGDAPRTPGELVIEVTMAAGILPGSKAIRIDRASASWALEIPSSIPRLRFVSDTPAPRFFPARLLMHGEPFFVECRFDEALDFSHRLAQVDLGNGLPPTPLLMTRVEGEELIYRSPRLRVVKPGPAAAQPEDGEDAAIPLPVAVGHSLLVESGDTAEPQHWGGIPVYEAGALDQATIIVMPARTERWHSDRSIHRITKEQPFAVRLRMPHMQDDEEITLRFERVNGGEGFDVTCKRMASTDGEPFAYYAPTAPLTIARGQANWFTGGVFPLALPNIDDGDKLRIRFRRGDSTVTHTLTVHDTELNRQIAVLKHNAEMLRDGGMILLTDSRLDRDDRDEVEFRVALANHALLLIQREDLWGIHKAVVLEAYLGMAQEPLEWHADRPAVEIDPRYGLKLLSAREQEVLYHAIEVLARDRINTAQINFVGNMGISAAEGAMGHFTAIDIYTMVTGLDARGKPVSFMGRVFSGLKAAAAIMNVRRTNRGRGPFGQRIDRANADRTARPQPLTPAEATRQLEIEMRRAGVPASRVAREAQSMLRTTDRLSAEAAAVGRAIDNGTSPQVLMRRMGRTREQVGEMLDDYYRHGVGIDNPQVRQRMLRRTMGDSAAPATNSRVGSASRTDVDAPNPRPNSSDGSLRNNEDSWPSMNDVDASGSRTRNSGHAPLSSSNSFKDSDFEDMEWDMAITTGRAQLPHRGPARMKAYHDSRIQMHEALLRERGMSADDITASTANLRQRYQQHLETVGLVEKARTWREYRDLQAAALFTDKGFTPQQSAIGHLYLNEMKLDGASAAVIRQTRATHADIPAALGIDRATWRAELGTFLKRNYGDMTDAQLNTSLNDYFRFVDGGS